MRTVLALMITMALAAPAYAAPDDPPRPITPRQADRAVKKQIKRTYPRSEFGFGVCGGWSSPREPAPRRLRYKCIYAFRFPETPAESLLQGNATVSVKRGQRIVVKLGPYQTIAE